jgi:hypothetical protein
MNRLILLPFLAALALHAQGTAESFLGRLPSPPTPSGASLATRQEFYRQIDDVVKEIDAQIQQESQAAKAASMSEETKAREQAMQAYSGQAPEGKLSPEERKALAAKVVQERTGMSMQDIDKLRAMTPEERRVWATSDDAKAVATTAASKAPAPPKDKGLTADEMAEMLKLQRDMAARMAKVQLRYARLGKEFAAIPRSVPKDGYTPDGGGQDATSVKFGQDYQAILTDHIAVVRQNIPDSLRLATLVAKLQGVQLPPGTAGLGEVREYAQSLRGIYQFNQ